MNLYLKIENLYLYQVSIKNQNNAHTQAIKRPACYTPKSKSYVQSSPLSDEV